MSHTNDTEQTKPEPDASKVVMDGIYNQAIDHAIEIVKREPVRFAEFDFMGESILSSIVLKLNSLKTKNTTT